MKYKCSQCEHDNLGALTKAEQNMYRAAALILEGLNETIAERGGWQRYAALLSTRPVTIGGDES